jgi:hypothetical protein
MVGANQLILRGHPIDTQGELQRQSKKSMGSINPVWRQSLEYSYMWDEHPQVRGGLCGLR